MKIKILRSLTCCLLALSITAGLLRADRASDLRNEVIPPGSVMTPPWQKYAGIVPAFGGPTGYTPTQLRHAYGVDQLNTTGQGQVIAIVDAYGSPTIQADLNTFCKQFNIPTATVIVYYPQGTPPIDPGYPSWATETSLDVEWAHAIAPGATIALIAAKSAYTTDLFAAVDFAVSLGATQISMSWNTPEYAAEGSSDFHFNVPGISFFAASGDNGAAVNYPTCSPYVVGVGGTTLNLDSSGNITSETGWSGSGGGTSVYETVPSYQVGWWNGPGRGVPDVAFDADPNTGVPVYLTGPGWQQIGGTSLSTPEWAALCALTNSLCLESIDTASGIFYSLATSPNYATYFHDITSGNNGAYSCGPGYDLVTGLGSPVGNQMVVALAGGYSSQVAAPVFFPSAGSYSSGQNVSIVSATPGASIRYTTDGSTPTETSGTLYTGSVSIGANIMFKALAYKSGFADSVVNGASYTFLPQVTAPTFSPAAGTYTIGQTVTISTVTPGASIRYTTDGSTPTETIGTLYAGPVSIDSTENLQAIAYQNGFIDSPQTSGTYTINLPPYPTAPTFSPIPGTYASALTVTISTTIGGAAISYTTDGSTPTETNGTLYSGPVGITSTTVLKAAAYEHGVYTSGPVAGGIYTITSSPAVVVNVLYDFTDPDNSGIWPYSRLVQGSDGNFYGTTDGGGSYDPYDPSANQLGWGTVFKITPAGTLTTLAQFDDTDGIGPDALVQGSDGNFYGTTSFGASGNNGTIYKMTPAGVLTTLVLFNGADGSMPTGGLVQGSDGNFYGTTQQGGSYSIYGGTIYKMTPAGVLTTLFSFNNVDGGQSVAALIQGGDGNLYGTTAGEGNDGTVFKITPAGVFTNLVLFSGANGEEPTGALVQGSDGNFYGTTQLGGSYDYDPSTNQFGLGTVFKLTPAGVLTALFSFNGVDGQWPWAGLTQGNDGNFYGTTRLGGSNNYNPGNGDYGYGTIFKITPAGVSTTLVSFDGANGAYLYGALTKGSDGNFYGTTVGGGAAGFGVIFQLILPAPAQQVAAPAFSPAAGTYPSAQTVKITSATSGASIAYTTDGSTPTEVEGTVTNGTLLSNGGSVSIGTTTTLQAIAFKTGFPDSAVTSGTYTISVTVSSSNGFDDIPMSSSQTGTFTATFDASPSLSPSNAVVALCKGTQTAYTGLSCIARFNTSGDIDAYNGSSGYQAAAVIPYAKNTTYHFRMVVNVPANTYSVYVTPPGGSELTVGLNYGFRKAATSLDTWTIDVNKSPGGSVTVSNLSVSGSGGTVAAPSFSPGPGTYSATQPVIINDSTSGASVRYTTDGVTTPTETVGTLYTVSISISTTTKLEAIAYKTGMIDSTVTTGQYTINPTTRSLTGSSGNGFHALALTASQTGTFTATFDATPTVLPENAVVGLSKGVATAYGNLSCIARFNPTGQIDAYNGTAYQAASSISYAKNTTYHFRMVVNVTAHTYSVYVTPSGGTELTVGLNYAFRSTAVVSSLGTWNLDVNATPANCSLTANNLNP